MDCDTHPHSVNIVPFFMAVHNIAVVVMEYPGGCRHPMRLMGRDRRGDERWLHTAVRIRILLLLKADEPES